MSDSYVNIVPYENVITETYYYAIVNVLSLVLNTSVTCTVQLFDINRLLKRNDIVTLSGTDYTNWGSNDEYLVVTVLGKLGIQLAPTN
jgi:hypothetical protein